MKYRIFGTILVLVVLCGLYIVVNHNDGNNVPQVSNSQPVDPEANALKGLKIN